MPPRRIVLGHLQSALGLRPTFTLHPRRPCLGPLTALALLLIPGPARADDVEPPPTHCPPGTRGTSSGGVPRCAPIACDGGCPAGLLCIEQPYCVESLRCGGRGAAEEEPGCARDHLHGACDAAGGCTRGVCASRRVCLAAPLAPAPPAPAAAPSEPASAACQVRPRRADPAALGLALLGVVAAWRAVRARGVRRTGLGPQRRSRSSMAAR